MTWYEYVYIRHAVFIGWSFMIKLIEELISRQILCLENLPDLIITRNCRWTPHIVFLPNFSPNFSNFFSIKPVCTAIWFLTSQIFSKQISLRFYSNFIIELEICLIRIFYLFLKVLKYKAKKKLYRLLMIH